MLGSQGIFLRVRCIADIRLGLTCFCESCHGLGPAQDKDEDEDDGVG